MIGRYRGVNSLQSAGRKGGSEVTIGDAFPETRQIAILSAAHILL